MTYRKPTPAEIQAIHEELHRLAREEHGRQLTQQEMHAMAERMLRGETADHAMNAFLHQHHHGDIHE